MALLVSLSALSCDDKVSAPQDALERLFPAIERSQVRAYRNQSWCKNILYARGAFSDTASPSTCNLFDEPAHPFDQQAALDFATIRDEIAGTRLQVDYFNVSLDGHGHVAQADFVLRGCADCSLLGYTFEPDYVLGTPGPDEKFTAIDQDWYKVEVH